MRKQSGGKPNSFCHTDFLVLSEIAICFQDFFAILF